MTLFDLSFRILVLLFISRASYDRLWAEDKKSDLQVVTYAITALFSLAWCAAALVDLLPKFKSNL